MTLAALLTGLALTERVTERLRNAGYADVRFSHGFVFQHLIGEPLPIGALAARMAVSQQAASKAVADLERLGYLERLRDPTDKRVRLVALSERGRASVEAARAARAQVAAELAAALGPERTERLRGELLAALDAAGGTDAVRARRVPTVR